MKKKIKQIKRFVQTSSQSLSFQSIITIADRETGVEYAVLSSGTGTTSPVPLINADGTPKTVNISDFEEVKE